MEIKGWLIEILVILFVAFSAFISESYILINLGQYQLFGPDPYLFFRYFEELVHTGTIPNYDIYRYYPLGFGLDNTNLVSFEGYLNYLLLQNPYYFNFISSILRLYNISVSQNLWFVANSLMPLLSAISSIIFYLLARNILRNRIYALIATAIFIASPALISRIVEFDKEIAVLPFMLLGVYSYLKAKEVQPEKNIIKKISIIIFILLSIISFYYVTYKLNNTVYQSIALLSSLSIFLVLYPIFKGSKDYFYTLSLFSTAIAMKGWGGWIFLPISISVIELILFFYDKSDLELLYYSPYSVYSMILNYSLSFRNFFETTYLIIFAPIFITLIWKIINKERIKKAINSIFKREIRLSKYTYFLIILLLVSPYIAKVIFKDIVINPFYSSRMLSSVAEYQPTTSSYYLSVFTPSILVLTFLGSFYILSKSQYKNLNKKMMYVLFLLIILYNILSFKEILNAILIVGSIGGIIYIYKKGLDQTANYLFITLSLLSFFYITFFLDVGYANSLSILSSWGLTLTVILPYFVISVKDIDERTIVSFIIFLTALIFAKYVYRLVYFTPFFSPIIAVYSAEWINYIKDIKNKYLKISKEILINILFIIASITGISIFFVTRAIYFLLPVFIYIPFIILNYFTNKEIDIDSFLKYSLLLAYIFGIAIIFSNKIYGYIGYAINYLQPLYIGPGTPQYLVNSMLYIKENTPNDSIVNSWWDYGYYIQTIAQRFTWLDGGNAYPYWNHLMGRYGFSSSFEDALQLFYVHAVYNYNTFKILELFNENEIFYTYVYKYLNLTKQDLNTIVELKKRLGNEWIPMLFSFNGTYQSIEKYNITEQEYEVLKKIYYSSYLKPSYLYIDPTDIGKSYEFMRLGANEDYDKESWVVVFQSAIQVSPNEILNVPSVYVNENGNTYAVFANGNSLYYFGDFPLDQDLNISGQILTRCIPDLGVTNCPSINTVQLVFKEPIAVQNGIYQTLNFSNINPDNLEGAYVYINDNGQIFNLSLYCVSFGGNTVYFNNSEYGGCLYISPDLSMILNGEDVGNIMYAYFLSQKIMNYSWVKLYFFNEGSEYFKLAFYSNELVYTGSGYITLPPTIYYDVPPAKVWEIIFPENFTVPEYKYCLYLATNLNQINECAKLYNLTPYTSYYNV